MNFASLLSMCFALWEGPRQINLKADKVKAGSKAHVIGTQSETVCVLGPPGVGKTAVGRDLANLMFKTMRKKDPEAKPPKLVILDLSSMLPEDLMGLPKVDGEVTRYVPQDWLAELCEPDAYGVLVLDDLPASSRQVQIACRQVSLDRRIHQMNLAPGIFIMVTGNRRQDKSSATTLPAHFRNSVILADFTPEFKDWEKWFRAEGFDGVIPAYLQYKTAHFSQFPKDADNLGAFATPRTWAKMAGLIPYLPEDKRLDVASGLVGEGVAIELMAFWDLRESLVSPLEVLKDPKKAIPDLSVVSGLDRIIALVTGLAELTSKMSLEGDKEVIAQFLAALSYVTSDNKREYVAMGISTFITCGGNLIDLVDGGKKARKDNPDIDELLLDIGKIFAKG